MDKLQGLTPEVTLINKSGLGSLHFIGTCLGFTRNLMEYERIHKLQKSDRYGFMNNQLPDEVVHNVLSRLSAKPLMRFRCVSTYWNSQITESYFKSRGRRILISDPYLHALNPKNVYSTVKLPFPFAKDRYRKRTIVVGTLYGIAILALEREDDVEFILYNPLTRVAQKLPDPPRPCCTSAKTYCRYGFGDSKIVIKYDNEHCHCFDSKYCHVFSLKKGSGSWTTPKTAFRNEFVVGRVGVFLNGYLHWISRSWDRCILALNVEDMEVSTMYMPDDGAFYLLRFLGTLKRRLCMVTKRDGGFFDVWVMMKKNWWSKKHSFTLGIEHGHSRLYVVCTLEDGKIVVRDPNSRHLIFYDPSKGSHNMFKASKLMLVFATGIEYVESLASPSDISYFCALP